MSDWTAQRVEQLAPDGAAVKAAQSVAKPNKWSSLGRNEQLLWGECQGSGANPYQVRVDLGDAANKCSCPSRKLPCKHALGLLLLLADGKSVPAGKPPAFVEEWAANRSKRADARQKKEETAASAPPADPQAQARRAEKRESRVNAGLDQLEVWLADIVAQGLAAARGQPPTFWSQMAARLVDAQAPGLARRVSELGDRALAEVRWQAGMLRSLAELQLLIDAWRGIGRLPEPLAAEVRTLIGWTQSQEDLRERPGVRDHWQVVGRRQSQDDRLRVQYTWLHGANTASLAMILEFAVGAQPLPANYSLGQVLDLELVYFDGVPALRALEKARHGTAPRRLTLPPAADIHALQSGRAAALSVNPWLGSRPFMLGPVRPVMQGERLWLEDAAGRRVTVNEKFPLGWHLLGLAGSDTLSLFGVWDGEVFEPLTVEHAGLWYTPAQVNALALWSKVA
jgi:hypothetical protein